MPVHQFTRPRRAALRGAVASLALALVASACGGSSGSTLAARALPSQDSGIEGVPVPISAELEYSRLGEREYVVTNMSYREVAGWYATMMPAGRNFGDWQWCLGLSESGRLGQVYNRGEIGILILEVFDYRNGVGIAIGTGSRRDLGLSEDDC
jgi:hypothetical protein